ncbi:polyprenyl synthetase family protein [Streptomyces sp. NPDC047017]|uniref:polyprenyl synthetase family protein n=1 Tax=Streptomyces sp. NPDC047017 TaxID=3155024 RepID=UPI0033EBBF39
MNAVSYEELHRRLAPEIEAARAAALALLDPAAPAVREGVAALLEHRTFTYPLSVLPLIVHAAETGDPRPALPLAVVHDLWWTSACCLDDLADSQGACPAGDLGQSEALLATVLAGTTLPLLVVQAQPVPEPVRALLAAEVVKCSIGAAEGQLRDLRGQVRGATRASVTEVYLGKSGAPYSMITAMAALLAGADGRRVALWREFGDVFGVLWQLFNDQEDILSGRGEDLRNGTVTYLLACALEDPAPGAAAHLTSLHRAATHSAPARTELTRLLLAPDVLSRYEQDLDAFRHRAHRVLDDLGGDDAHLPLLRDLVDRSSRMLLRKGEG